MINLKLSEKEKYKNDGQWFKDYLDMTVPNMIPDSEDYESMLSSYKIVNNDLTDFKSKLNQFCNPLGEDLGEVDEEIQPYPELHNAVNILKGEVVQRKDQLHLMLLSANAIKDKDKQLLDAIKLSVDEKFAIDIQKMEFEMQGMDEKQVAEFTKGLRTQLEPEDLAQKKWLSEVEIFYNKALQFCNYDQNILDKRVDTMGDVAVSDRMFIYVGWKHGKPVIEIRNPLYMKWHKSPNEKLVHKSSWIVSQKPITLVDAMENYNLSEDDIDKLSVNIGRGLDKRHSIGKDSKVVFDHTKQDLLINQGLNNVDKTIGLNQTDSSLTHNKELVWETHFEFKAFKEVIFLSYKDEYNENIVTILDSKFEIPSDAIKQKFINRFDMESEKFIWINQGVEFEAEKLYVPRKYEIVRLNDSVYPVYREVPYQVTNLERPFDAFELSTKGGVINARNAKSVSLVQRAIPPYLQFLWVKHVMNRELAAYQGAIQSIDIDQIPDDLGKDIYGENIRSKLVTYLVMLKKSNKDIYSGSQSSYGSLPPSTRSPGSNGYMIGTAVELMNLHQLAELIKQEIAMAMGISPQRQASFQQGSNVSDNQQSIQQSYAITEPYFFTHSNIWKDALNEWLTNFRTYCDTQMRIRNLSELSFQYWLPGNIEETLKVTPNSLQHTDIGLFLSTSSSFETYARYMLENVQAFAQNQGQGVTAVSQIIKDIVSKASPEEIHKRIQIEEAKMQERSAQLQSMNAQAQEKLEQMKIEAREDEQQHEKEVVVLKAEQERITEIQKAGIQATMLGKQQDLNNNNVPDSVDLANMYLKEKQQDLKVAEFKHKEHVDEEKLAIERKKLTANKSSKK